MTVSISNTLKKALAAFLVFCMAAVFAGCSSSANNLGPLEMKETDMEKLAKMMDDKETFTLVVERDECTFCKAMNDYLEKTRSEHPGVYNVYVLNTTDYELFRENEGDMTLISSTEQGKQFLERFPYFLYTPAIYKIEDGKPVDAGIGYDENRHTVSNWNVDSTIDWNQAKPVDVWTFLGAAGTSQEASFQSSAS